MNYRKEITELQIKLDDLKKKQISIENNCNKHEWGEPVDTSWVENTFWVDHNITTKVYDRKIDHERWTRECNYCGKQQHTEKKKPTNFIPDFN